MTPDSAEINLQYIQIEDKKWVYLQAIICWKIRLNESTYFERWLPLSKFRTQCQEVPYTIYKGVVDTEIVNCYIFEDIRFSALIFHQAISEYQPGKQQHVSSL